ncbi:hypothetical protein T492DRAFT_1024879 [Pavlovales sp. CCMP2436]|nr:hypothetical protein T492DRAFT_1024879 [Pavlovales sp. CCMP2436]
MEYARHRPGAPRGNSCRGMLPWGLLAAVLLVVGLNTFSLTSRARPGPLRRALDCDPKTGECTRRVSYARRAAASSSPPPSDGKGGAGGTGFHAASLECRALAARHGVVVGENWGTLGQLQIERWRVLGCDRYVLSASAYPRRAPAQQASRAPAWAGAPAAPASGSWGEWLSSSASGYSPESAALIAARCATLLRRAPDMLPGTNWGSMAERDRQVWESLDCARNEPSLAAGRRHEIEYIAEFEGTLRQALAARRTRLRKRADPAAPLVVAIGVSSTTRTLSVSAVQELSLFRLMLPSLVRTAQVGFEYWIYIAHDMGDKFFDSAATSRLVVAWCAEHVVGPLRARGIDASVLLLRFNNTVGKPGPVFNYMMAAAAEDGADFLYRINDDTELEGGSWTSQAVEALGRRNNVGVVGPICFEGNVNILTHDFVHRTHLEIHRTYYPPVFTDWYMDDWISKVYGPARTQKGPFRVTHHIGAHATRYAVDRAHELALTRELVSGLRLINSFCRAHTERCQPSAAYQMDTDAWETDTDAWEGGRVLPEDRDAQAGDAGGGYDKEEEGGEGVDEDEFAFPAGQREGDSSGDAEGYADEDGGDDDYRFDGEAGGLDEGEEGDELDGWADEGGGEEGDEGGERGAKGLDDGEEEVDEEGLDGGDEDTLLALEDEVDADAQEEFTGGDSSSTLQ